MRRSRYRYDICNLVASIILQDRHPVVCVEDGDLPPLHLAACEFHDSIDMSGSPKDKSSVSVINRHCSPRKVRARKPICEQQVQ